MSGATSSDGSSLPTSDIAPPPGGVPDLSATGPQLAAPPALTPAVPSSPRAPRRSTGTVAVASGSRDAAQPPFAPLALALVVGAVALLAGAPPLRRRLVVPARVRDPRAHGALGAGLLLALAALPMAASEVTTFKAGLVLIFLVAVLGLHILVNWAGQLSLAHAGMVGFPAFVALGLSDVYGVSPIYLVPIAAVVGAGVGAVVALPTLRAQGLQVALVTLAAGVAIDRYFFTKSWLVGPSGGRAAADQTLGPWRFDTSRGLYPILLVFVVLAAVAAWLLMHSKVARAWSWVRSDPAAAAAFGIPVVAHRILAFAVGGAFAGLAGGLSVMWVERLTPLSFPTGLSFSYLLVAVISGPGYLGGLAFAAALLEGGRLFSAGAGTLVSYAGPVALILVITRYSAGINGAGRSVMERVRASRPFAALVERSAEEAEPITVGLVFGMLAVAGGFLAIAVAWYHAGNTDQVWIQNQEIMSGGFGGLSLVVTGSALLIRDRMGRSQAALIRSLEAVGRAAAAEVPDFIPELVAPEESEPLPGRKRTGRSPLPARVRS
jgi:branched-chain amino acid transport system permease protein